MSRKQAVVLIHGIGDQRPMETLRGFVKTVWLEDPNMVNAGGKIGLWSKPDTVSRSYELRRLTTSQTKTGIRTDFFEFYWAPLMHGTSYGHVISWARSVLLRFPGKIPSHLRVLYRVLWISIFVLLVFWVLTNLYLIEKSIISPWLVNLLIVCLSPIVGWVCLQVVGDAARYLHKAPANIQRRHEIRKAGIELLLQLHDEKYKYERIIVVGHSLGSVIGYDILTHVWVDFHQEAKGGTMTALGELETLATKTSEDSDSIQSAQREYFEELRRNGCRWKVTDFITLGSPLAHAEILMAKDKNDWKKKQVEREFPRCLPELESETEGFSFSFPGRSYRVPHHAAVFGPTRWTNLYFPSKWIFWGDIIGGPLREIMGNGVKDVAVETSRRGGFLSHTLYWTVGKRSQQGHIEELRKALDLADTRSAPPRS